MTKPILIENNAGVLTLTINRPEKKNALTDEMYNLLSDGFMTATQEPSVKVVLLIGSGADFTGGNDLKDFIKWGQATELDELPVIRLIKQIVNFEKPLVAAVKGAAVGFGTTLLLHCDVVVAGHSAQFSLPFSRLAVVPEFGCSYLFPRYAGKVRARHLMMLGDNFGPQEAQEMGIVSLVCPDEAVAEQAQAKCQQFAHLPSRSLRAIKAMITPPEERQKLLDIIDQETQEFAKGLQSAEHREAITAFFEKRPPNFAQFD